MTGYTSDQEQIEAIRQWWRENGRPIIAGVLIAIAGVGGWQGWQSWQESRAMEASRLYESLSAALAADKLPAAVATLDTLRADHPDNAQTGLATLEVAARQVATDDAASARDTLQWLVDNGETAALVNVARLHLAETLIAVDSVDEAGEVLAAIDGGPFAARAREIEGDIARLRGEDESAVEAYRAAIDAGPTAERRRLLTRKLADLGAPVEDT